MWWHYDDERVNRIFNKHDSKNFKQNNNPLSHKQIWVFFKILLVTFELILDVHGEHPGLGSG